MVHVRAPEPPGPAGCTIPGIVDCGDIVNSTTLTGEVEFDIFIQVGSGTPPADPLYYLQTTLTWPASWQFVRWEACPGADGWFVPEGGTGALEAVWTDCPLVDYVLLVGRLVLNVTGYGYVLPSMDGVLYKNCPPAQPVALEAVGVFAEAGVDCNFTRMFCRPVPYCLPTLSVTEVAFSTGPGGVLAADIPFEVLSPSGASCPYVVETEAAWLSGSYQELDVENYILHLVSNPVGLAPGTYATRAMLTTPGPWTRRCLGVTLEIPANSGLPDGGEPEQEVRMSWSRVKSIYR
jgi:hypothetical protein